MGVDRQGRPPQLWRDSSGMIVWDPYSRVDEEMMETAQIFGNMFDFE